MQRRADYVPTELFSPSGLATWLSCNRMGGFRYIQGLKEAEVAWVDLPPEPVAAVKSRPTNEEKDAKKAWRKMMRPALGKAVHAKLEQYYQHAMYPCVALPVDWTDKSGQIALAGLCYLPPPSECLHVEVEAGISIDTWLHDEQLLDDPITFRGTRDLLVQRNSGKWLLIDHKSTYSFDYIDREKTIKTVKTPAQLKADPQANLYALDVMQKHGLDALDCRWVYYRTEDGPAACAVDFVIKRADAEAVVAKLVAVAIEMRASMRMRTEPNCLQASIESCGKFGGCAYYPDRGGPCEPPQMSTGSKLVQLRQKKQLHKQLQAEPKVSVTVTTTKAKGRYNMALGFRAKAEAAEAAKKSAPAETTAIEVSATPSEGAEVVDAGSESAEVVDAGSESEAGEIVNEAPAEVETPAEKQERKARAPKAAKAKLPINGGLGASLANLSEQLVKNEAEHEEILSMIREVVGAA